LHGPLRLAELVGVAADVRMETPRTFSERPLDRIAAGPSSPEARRLDPDGVESEDAKRGVDAFGLQVEFAEVVEDAAGLMPALDAVPPVPVADLGIRAVVPATGEAEEPVRHGVGWRTALMGFGVRRPGQRLY
jgi:hypothetical protein